MKRKKWKKRIFWKKHRYISRKENQPNGKEGRMQEESFKMYEGENERDV